MTNEEIKIKVDAYCDILELMYKRMGVCHDSIITFMRDGSNVCAGYKRTELGILEQLASQLASKIQFMLAKNNSTKNEEQC